MDDEFYTKVEDWNVGLVVHLGVQFNGTAEQAREHVNKLAGYVQHTLNEAGIFVSRREHTIRRKEEVVNVNDLSAIAGSDGNPQAA